MVLTGQRIGRIRVEGRLGGGGMGEVYRGWDEGLQRTVAVKTLRAERRLSREARARVLREARILSRLDHPGICRIHDLLEHEGTDVLVLEYVDGRTLDRAVTAGADRERVLRLVLRTAEALAVAHAEGVVHRDVKPANVMVTADDQVKILDFGIARSFDAPVAPAALRATPSVPTGSAAGDADTVGLDEWRGNPSVVDPTVATVEGSVLGTIRYMSPEQAAGEPVTSASDMYSLGVVLHELLTGEAPYGERDGVPLLLSVYRADTRPIAGVDPELARLVERLESVNPAERPSAEETADCLRAVLDAPSRRRRRRIRVAAAAAVAVMVVVALGVAGYSRLESDRRAELARRFGEEASALQWIMRAEYLSPRHDISEGRARVESRMAAVAERIEQVGRRAAGPGAYALGVGHLALGRMGDARHHLERAWDAGHRAPEVAFALGVALTELYSERLGALARIGDPEVRRVAAEALRRELSRPAMELLVRCQGAELVPSAYLEGLIALHQERYDEGIQAAGEASRALPWFFEAQFLEGELHRAAANDARFGKDHRRQLEHLRLSAAAYERAAEIGRSSHKAWAGACSARSTLVATMWTDLGRTPADEDLAAQADACAAALEVLPDSGFLRAEQARVEAARAVAAVGSETDPAPGFEAALAAFAEAAALEPDSAHVLDLAGWAAARYAFYLNQRGADAREVLDTAAAYQRRRLELEPGGVAPKLALGQISYIRALQETWYGDRPGPHLEEGIESLERLVEEVPDAGNAWETLGALYWMSAYAESVAGRTVGEHADACIHAYARAAALSLSPDSYRSLAFAHLNRAQQHRAAGRDPRPDYRAAIGAAGRAVELAPGMGLAHATVALGHKGLAQQASLEDGDVLGPAGEAAEHFERAVELAPTDVPIRQEYADLLLLKARVELAEGLPADATVEAARRHIRVAAAANPSIALIPIVAAQIEGVAARAADGPEAARAAFEEGVVEARRAIQLQESNPNAHRTLAELLRWRAEWTLDRGGDPEPDVAAGLAALDRTLELSPEIADAWALRAALLLVRFQATESDEARQAGRDAIGRALEIQPLLENPYRRVLDGLGVRGPSEADGAPQATTDA